MRTVTYLKNRSPTVALTTTPYEAQTGKVPNLSYIKRLRCRAYKIIPLLKKPRKLDNRAETRFLIGYKASNIYRLWNLNNSYIKRAKIVLFDKNLRLTRLETGIVFPKLGPNYLALIAPKMVLPYNSITRLPLYDIVEPSQQHKFRNQNALPPISQMFKGEDSDLQTSGHLPIIEPKQVHGSYPLSSSRLGLPTFSVYPAFALLPASALENPTAYTSAKHQAGILKRQQLDIRQAKEAKPKDTVKDQDFH